MKANYLDVHELTIQAGEAEAKKDFKAAAKFYEKIIKQQPTNEIAFNRLMIVYRKLKSYSDELRVIDKGIENFRKFYEKKRPKLKSNKSSVERLSLQLMKSTGLSNKKGIPNYEPKPISQWLKRREIVSKKI